MATTWKPRQRNYNFEKLKLQCKSEKTSAHPLKVGASKAISKQRSRQESQKIYPLSQLDGSDPLSLLTASSDPLSILSIGSNTDKGVDTPVAQNDDLEEFPGWDSVKTEVLNKYTTSEKLSITTSFLTTQGDSVKAVKQISVSDKVKTRLEQLDDFEDGSVREMLNLSQQDYVKRIDELNKALITAWSQDQRVKALKIAIQCAKVLADISVIQFYPSKFVLITEILDTFGNLVFERIWEKSTYTPPGSSKPVQLPENFTPEQVPESAKETCRNWFFKIASIRELIPRFYVETAILKCYRFFKPSEMTEALSRLAIMVRGMGNPLTANYARCYLCRVGVTIDMKRKEHLQACFNDLLQTYPQIEGNEMMGVISKRGVSVSTYLSLYSPAVDWLLTCMAYTADSELDKVLNQCSQHANSALLLNGILSSYKPSSIAARAKPFVEMIRDCEETGLPKSVLYRSFGQKLALADPPENEKIKILNEVWKFITKLKDPAEYIQCAEIWMDFVMKHFGRREMNTVLADIIKHMTPDRAFEDFYPNLLMIVRKIMEHVHNFSLLFSLEKFLPFVDMFRKESVKVDTAKIIVEAFNKYQLDSTSDPVIINTMMFMCKTLHDSVNALSLDDEIRAVSQLICAFIHKVDYGNNFEQQLNFYVDARANFTNLDTVMADLVQCVNNLAITTRKIVKGNHSKKTSAFVKACAAYCFITIPSLDNTFTQLNLYLLSLQVALLNGCLSQADALCKAGIAAILETPPTMTLEGKPKSSEGFVVQFINNYLSTLLVIPDNPDQGVLVLIKGLVNVIKVYKFDTEETRHKVYLNALVTLSAMSQDKYLYRVEKVESNDTLYGHDKKFLAEVEKLCSVVIEEIFTYLKGLADGFENLKKQSTAALLTLDNLVTHADLSDQGVFQLATKLWSLSQKHGYSDTRLSAMMLTSFKKRSEDDTNLARFVTKISG